MKFPETLTITCLRPDMVLISEVFNQIILFELTVPLEVHIEETNERKRTKYTESAGAMAEDLDKYLRGKCMNATLKIISTLS
ncbi:kinesin KIF2A [Labeo rohita]|uniref:Kinesin KIF2A n=1 Tax=Labeo rohita TaxID=84645 RepID=A0A498M0M6_LABRO|nr:kinesin KIF2A [Labeo rohita]RXN32918.1 kinesin KIF2A [Labeo rohita]